MVWGRPDIHKCPNGWNFMGRENDFLWGQNGAWVIFLMNFVCSDDNFYIWDATGASWTRGKLIREIGVDDFIKCYVRGGESSEAIEKPNQIKMADLNIYWFQAW